MIENPSAASAAKEVAKYAHGEHAWREGIGDVFADRASPEWPLLRGVEISEEEFRVLAGERGLERSGEGDAFSDRTFAEWPRYFGYEVPEG